MGLGVVHEPHDVPGGGLHAGDAAPAAMLGFEGIVVHPFDVVVAGEGNEDVLLGDEVFVLDVGGLIGDFGAPLVAEATSIPGSTPEAPAVGAATILPIEALTSSTPIA